MKYIRTKNGIYEVDHLYTEGGTYNTDFIYFCKGKRSEDLYALVKNSEVIKQADTIEELCDCFSCGIETVKDIDVARGWNINGRKIYACILTDKGLIYVAKMNNEGKLELL